MHEAVRQPGLIWCYHRDAGGGEALDARVAPPGCPFRWVHLNLSDQRSLRWLDDEARLPGEVRALMLTRDSHQRFVVEGDAVGVVLHDYERDFDPATMGRVGGLHVALVPGMMITGRYRPLHAADLFRRHLETNGGPPDNAAAFALLLDLLTDSLSMMVQDLTAMLLDIEESLIAEAEAPDMRDLIAARRQAAQLHRMTGGMRMTLQRMERAPGLPAALVPVTQEYQPRLALLDQDIVAAQNQLKLLRDELDLEAAQRTNSNVYLLSVLTALMMPATLVTGFFGMNTGGLPFAQGEHGTLMATLVAIVSAAASYLLLRMMGLVRRQ